MTVTCGPDAEQVTRSLGFDCHDVSPVVSVRNPLDLAHWSMPVLEVLIIAGAVFALVHALRRQRAGDPVNLALWCASLVYLLVIEPPLYFPEWFGLEERYGFIFAHNLFTVQFMWDRLPLYIVAFYPAFSQMAYELVRVLGIFRRRGALVGSLGVAFVCQVLYQVFDQLGPQLRWWAWNDANLQVNHPALASVPMNSMLLFASVSFGALTYLVVRLVGPLASVPGFPGADTRQRSTGGWSLVWRTVAAGALTPLAMVLASVPSGLFGGDTPNLTAQRWVLGVGLAVVWLAGAWVFVSHLARRETASLEPMSSFARIYPAAYLAVFALLWLGALPAFFGAEDGLTTHGTPIGSGFYTLACFVGATAVLAVLYTSRRPVAMRAG